MSLDALVWHPSRASEALAALVAASGLDDRGAPPARAGAGLEDAAHAFGVDAESVAAAYADVPLLLRSCAPALIRTAHGFVAAVRVRRGRLEVLHPDGERSWIALAPVVEALRATVTGGPAIEAATKLPERARDALYAARFRHVPIEGVTTIRRSIAAPVRVHSRDLRLGRRLATIAALHLVGYVLSILSWSAIGSTALTGRIDAGWLVAWALLIATSLAARIAATSAAGPLAIDTACALRLRLFAGSLRLPAEIARGEGVGRSLGRVFESQAVETLAVSGGFSAMFAAIELVVVVILLALGAGGLTQVVLLFVAMCATAVGVRNYAAARRAWTEERLEITHELIDSMNGHATRLAQQREADRHTVEDLALARYVRRSERLDRRTAWLQIVVPRGWLVVASIGLVPALLHGHTDVTALAFALGGTLLGYGALARLADAAIRLVDAAIAWRGVAPLVAAGGATSTPPSVSGASSPGLPLASVRGVSYRAPRGSNRVLAGCDLEVRDGDRILLEGTSGAGKSTLASVIAGLRMPDAGLVLAGGLDRVTVGDRGWRQRIAFVPQFHDNHVFLGPLAFNLLMARSWPPSPEDLAEAETVCRELGLGPLIERMPGGLFQFVGETGWQLSHGERSRVFVARALLSRAPLVILDESLAALDPDTLIDAIGCIERRARAALVIAHP